jgi:predicted nuclease with TOPRIM domain
MELRGRIERLKRQIEEVRHERQRILADGVRKVQSYMEQLRREHAQHAEEMQELRDADARLNERFLAEVEQLKLQYKNHRKPIDEIIRRVKAKIAQSPIAAGKTIESIHVTEVKES